MKKFMMLVMLGVMMVATGCGKKPEPRNYYFTDPDTGRRWNHLTQSEFEALLGAYERYENLKLVDIDYDYVTITFVDMSVSWEDGTWDDPDVTTWENADVTSW